MACVGVPLVPVAIMEKKAGDRCGWEAYPTDLMGHLGTAVVYLVRALPAGPLLVLGPTLSDAGVVKTVPALPGARWAL